MENEDFYENSKFLKVDHKNENSLRYHFMDFMSLVIHTAIVYD